MSRITRLPDWQHRWFFLLSKIRVVNSLEDEALLIHELTHLSETKILAFVNAYAMNSVVTDLDFFKAINVADILLRDGAGMSMLYKKRGLNQGLNMNGTDFIPKLLEAYKGKKVAFWGTQAPYLEQAALAAQSQFGIQLVSTRHGFDEAQAYVDLALHRQPDLIVLGMGMPKQEKVAAMIRDTGGRCLIVCGGAIIDFMGNKVKRAPQWVRKIGCEWLYRLVLEPKRLYKRYVFGNPIFILRTLRLHKSND